MREVLVTAGANGALGSFISAFLNKGDNMVIFEPAFPLYLDHASIAGCEVRSVPLNYVNNDWIFKPE